MEQFYESFLQDEFYNLSSLIDEYMTPSKDEKEDNAEVPTPFQLRKDMLDKLPDSFWENPLHTVFETSCGKGAFLIDFVIRFMKGLENVFPDKMERYRHIVENCIFFCDINPMNIHICKLLLDPYQRFELNYYQGNTLQFNIWGKEGFHAVIGNPPYNDDSGNKGKGHSIWTIFVERSFNKWLLPNGYLLFVHPGLWRQRNHELSTYYWNNNLIYLEIHGQEDGKKIFKCSTRYEFYLCQKSPYNGVTHIIDEKGKSYTINIQELEMIPNYDIDLYVSLTNSPNKLDVHYDRSIYGADKKWVVVEQSEEYCNPVVYNVQKGGVLNLRYTNTRLKGHYGIPKLIFNWNECFLDRNGDYALTQWVYHIRDEVDNLERIQEIFHKKSFKNFVLSFKIGYTLDINAMKTLNKNFWEHFL